MPDRLYDAHVHLVELRSELSGINSAYDEIGLGKAVVVSTSPEDWADVMNLCSTDNRFIPAVGLHPWRVNEAPDAWQEQLLGCLVQGARVIGELGLDQWIEGFDIDRQQEAFRWQLSLAAERNLPTSIHCLKAHEPLLQTLRAVELPERGFKLHAYNGPVDTMKPLLVLGAYFSFNAGQFKPSAKRVRELIRLVPDDRILVETDAPDFLPTTELREFDLEPAGPPVAASTGSGPRVNRGVDGGPENGDEQARALQDSASPPINHPANIRAGYRAIAELRGQSLDAFTDQVALNFGRYFET